MCLGIRIIPWHQWLLADIDSEANDYWEKDFFRSAVIERWIIVASSSSELFIENNFPGLATIATSFWSTSILLLLRELQNQGLKCKIHTGTWEPTRGEDNTMENFQLQYQRLITALKFFGLDWVWVSFQFLGIFQRAWRIHLETNLYPRLLEND